MRAARRPQHTAHGCREDGLMNLLCRRIATGIAALSAVCVAGVSSVSAQTYPSRPITIVLGFTPGAASDTAARLVGEHLSAAVGQPVVIDNRAGASGNLAAGFVARAPADGYTLMVGVDAVMTSNVHLFKTVPFDPDQGFCADHQHWRQHHLPCREFRVSSKIGCGIHRLRQGQSGQGQLRFVGRRLAAPSRG